MTRLCIIMGHGRSGSTALARLLGSSTGVEALGELCHFWREPDGGECSCGSVVGSCPVWGHVDLRTALAGWRRFRSTVESHGGFPVTFLGLWPSRTWSAYVRANRQVMRVLDDRGPSLELAVDSSKYAGRAYGAARALGERDVRVIWIRRSPEGIMDSFLSSKVGHHPTKTIPNLVAYYAWVGLCCRLVKWRLKDRVLEVSSERIAADPDREVARLADFLGVDLPGSLQAARGETFLSPGHIVTGNRMRLNPSLRYAPPDDRAPEASLLRRVALACMRTVDAILGLR